MRACPSLRVRGQAQRDAEGSPCVWRESQRDPMQVACSGEPYLRKCIRAGPERGSFREGHSQATEQQTCPYEPSTHCFYGPFHFRRESSLLSLLETKERHYRYMLPLWRSTPSHSMQAQGCDLLFVQKEGSFCSGLPIKTMVAVAPEVKKHLESGQKHPLHG